MLSILKHSGTMDVSVSAHCRLLFLGKHWPNKFTTNDNCAQTRSDDAINRPITTASSISWMLAVGLCLCMLFNWPPRISIGFSVRTTQKWFFFFHRICGWPRLNSDLWMLDASQCKHVEHKRYLFDFFLQLYCGCIGSNSSCGGVGKMNEENNTHIVHWKWLAAWPSNRFFFDLVFPTTHRYDNYYYSLSLLHYESILSLFFLSFTETWLLASSKIN